MRFDTPVNFVAEISSTYNTETGDYDDGQTRKEYRLANVMDTTTQTMNLVYGKIKQGSSTIIIQGDMPRPFDYILIGSKRYRVDTSRQLRRLVTFIVSEIQP